MTKLVRLAICLTVAAVVCVAQDVVSVVRGTVRCSPSFGPKSGLLKVDRCLQYIIERSLLLGLWEL